MIIKIEKPDITLFLFKKHTKVAKNARKQLLRIKIV
jgi:hypothetical protein